jgi:hypothetical protein
VGGSDSERVGSPRTQRDQGLGRAEGVDGDWGQRVLPAEGAAVSPC